MSFYNNLFLCGIFIIAFVSEFSQGAPPSKIVGGTNAAITTWPSIVSIRLNNQHFCGGTLITNCHVLTAAHCVFGMNKNSFTIAAGSSDQMNFRNFYRVKNYNVYPKYTGPSTMYLHDIAVITLEQCIIEDGTKRISRIYQNYVPNNVIGTVVGWGKLSKNSYTTARFLQQLPVRVMDNSECLNSYSVNSIRPTQKCGIHSVDHGFCSGDSGGPLFVNINGITELIGIVSMAFECAIGIPDIYTLVIHYVDWINAATR